MIWCTRYIRIHTYICAGDSWGWNETINVANVFNFISKPKKKKWEKNWNIFHWFRWNLFGTGQNPREKKQIVYNMRKSPKTISCKILCHLTFSQMKQTEIIHLFFCLWWIKDLLFVVVVVIRWNRNNNKKVKRRQNLVSQLCVLIW